MPRALLSILGTNDYLNCKYRDSSRETSEIVKYIQEGLVSLHTKGWNEEDQIRIFLTNEAKQKNWEDDGHKDKSGNIIRNAGLAARLKNLNLSSKIVPVDIPIGSNESEIWKIFEIIYNSFREGEEVIIDVTHSFRSLPMLMMVLINYARLLKKIKVKAIYYGAFENLGSTSEAAKIPEDERIAPIFDLSSFINLLDWTLATYNFLENGITSNLKQLTQTQLSNIARYSKETGGEWSKELKSFVNDIHETASNILFCRGHEIVNHNYEKAMEVSEKLKSHAKEIGIKPIIPLIDEITHKMSVYKNNNVINGFHAVEWCIEHNLIQQAITIFYETIVTLINTLYNKNVSDKTFRELISSALYIKARNTPEKDWMGAAKTNPDECKKLLEMEIINDISIEYMQLSDLRNDINHAGFKSQNFAYCTLKNNFIKIYDKIKNKLTSRGIL